MYFKLKLLLINFLSAKDLVNVSGIDQNSVRVYVHNKVADFL